MSSDDLTEAEIERVLEWYYKAPSEDLAGEEILPDGSWESLVVIFDPEDEDAGMLDAYEVEQGDVEALQKLVSHRIDLAKFDYFVAAYAKEG
ncbi:MAG: Cloacin immunity protein [Verrucomicrobiota bacterium]|jgi:hypothetical protein